MKSKINPKMFFPLGLGLMITIGILIIFKKYIFGGYTYIFDDIGSDTITLFYPKMLETMYKFKEYGLNTWSFSEGLGNNAYGSGLLDPVKLPLAFLSPKGIAHYIIYQQILHIGLASFLFYKYLSLLSIHKKAVAIGTLMFTFQGWLIGSSSWYGHTSSYLQFALLLYTFELLVKRNLWWPFALAIWYAFSTKIYFFAEFMVLYSFIRLSDLEGFNWKYVRSKTAPVLKAIGLGILLFGPFLGSLIYNMIYSPRVGGEFSYAESLSSTPITFIESKLHNWSIVLRTFGSEIFGTGSDYKGYNNYLEGPNLYAGILAVILLPQVFYTLTKTQKWVYSGILFFWVLLLTFPYFRYGFYAFSGSYFKSAINIFIPFTLIYFSVRSMDALFTAGKLHKGLLLLSSVIVLFLLHGPKSVDDLLNERMIWLSSLSLLAFTILLLAGYKNFAKPWFFYSLFMIAFVEMIGSGLQSTENRSALKKSFFDARTGHNDYTLEAIKYFETQSEPFYRVEKTFGSVKNGYNDAIAQNYFSSKSYNSHNHNNYISFLKETGALVETSEVHTRWVIGLVSSYFLHPLMSVKYIISTPESDKYVWKSIYKNIGYMNGLTLYQNNAYLPMGIPFENYFYRNEYKALTSIEQKHMLFYKGIVIEDEDQNKFPQLKHADLKGISNPGSLMSITSNLRQQSMKMDDFAQNNIQGTIRLQKPSMVFFSIPFDAGWKAYIDGKKAPLHLINFGMTGLLVDQGEHKIQMKYVPPYFVIGWILFAVGTILLVYIIFKSRKGKS